MSWLFTLIPNVIEYWDQFLSSIVDTLLMMLYSGVFIFVLGILLGTLMVVSRPGGILANRLVYQVLEKTINLFRSIPFVILIVALYPVTLSLIGTGIGLKGAIFPLVIGATPFFTRQVQMALSEVDPGVIEAAEAMGLTPLEIIFRVYLRESIPALARATTFTLVSLLGLTAVSGAVGAGGIGSFVIRYGQNRYMYDITYVSVFVILVIVSLIEALGTYIARKTTH